MLQNGLIEAPITSLSSQSTYLIQQPAYGIIRLLQEIFLMHDQDSVRSEPKATMKPTRFSFTEVTYPLPPDLTQTSNTDVQRQRNTALDEIFVLSLPGFVWIKANYTATNPRINHACNVVANRQMIVTGGLNPASSNQSELVQRRDVWSQGIGVFDLSTMQWKDRYDANAEPYTTPNVVKDCYTANGPFPVQWDDPSVA